MAIRASEKRSLIDSTFGRVAESLRDDETLAMIAEYEAVRQEILFRLQAQQSLLQYTILIGGLPIPLIALFWDVDLQYSPQAVTFLLLLFIIPVILCIFVQLVYFKHHLHNYWLSLYIADELGILITDETKSLDHFPIRVEKLNGNELRRALVFSGWEEYHHKAARTSFLTKAFSLVLGAAEGYFPLMVASCYIFAGGLIYLLVKDGWPTTLSDWVIVGLYLIAVVCLLAIAAGGQVMRRWVMYKRNAINR